MMNSMPTIPMLAVIFLVLTQCRSVQSDAKLIEETCKQTPHYDLCVTNLKSDPRSSTADVKGLALIMVDKLEDVTTRAVKFADKRPRLSYCASLYKGILISDIPYAIDALQSGEYEYAIWNINDAADTADKCEREFQGKSPLTKYNRLISDTSRVTSAIIKLLL